MNCFCDKKIVEYRGIAKLTVAGVATKIQKTPSETGAKYLACGFTGGSQFIAGLYFN